MIKVGITGGIGSGKTFVSQIFEHLGIPVLNADNLSKSIIHSNQDIQLAIKAKLGTEFFNHKNELDTQKLGQHVFSNPEALEILNQIIHPEVQKETTKWFAAQNGPYALKEAAILFESGSYKNLEKSILVTAPETLKMKRILERVGMNETKANDIMKRQWLDDKKRKLADFTIVNDEKALLLPQVLKIHQNLIGQYDSK